MGKVKFLLNSDASSVINADPSDKVQVVGFVIEGGVITPSELPAVEEAVERDVAPALDPAKPTIVTGRGPTWLYATILHGIHYFSELAVWDPRAKAGIVVQAPTRDLLGSGLTVNGEHVDVRLGGKGDILVKAGTRNINLVHVEIVGDRFVEPAKLRELKLPEVDTTKPVVLEGPAPIWLYSHMALRYMHKTPFLAIYDPRLGAGVVVASHTETVKVGSLVKLDKSLIQSILGEHDTRVIGVVGDPNSGKSVFLHLLNAELRRRGYLTLTQEGDLTAPTQEWSLHDSEVRKKLKTVMDPEERLKWVVSALQKVRGEKTVDFVLVDVGGGRPDLGKRITPENLAILSNVDGVIVVSRNDAGQIRAWLEELKRYLPNVKVYAVLESRLQGRATVSEDGFGVVVGLDRRLYREGRVPRDTIEVVRRVADRVVGDKPVDASKLLSEGERESVSA